MPNCNETPPEFVLSAEDHDLACSVLQMRFVIDDLQKLVVLIPDAHTDDPQIWQRSYEFEDESWRRIVETFEVPFDTAGLDGRKITVCVWRLHPLARVPYLVHTGFELLLLLDGRKKLARMGDAYPPTTFRGEEAFDRQVEAGVLHREEVIEPFEKPHRGWDGIRTVYYTPKGEEWRISAMKLIWSAFRKAGGWNDTYERLEGMLFGYEDWQNDWWIEHRRQRGGGYSGAAFCCAVTAEGLRWMEQAGFKALPPICGEALALFAFDPDYATQSADMLGADPEVVAIVRFSIPRRTLTDTIDLQGAGPWRFPASRIPDLNRALDGSVELMLQRI